MRLIRSGVFFALLLPCTLFGQGTLRGIVTDSVSREPLIGANIHLRGTAWGAVTDREGGYRISGITPGQYVIRVSYIGYVTREVNRTIPAGEATLSVALVPDVLEGEEVVVTGQARGQIAAINQQISSNTIVNVISEEKIKELPDANAAEAIGRLPGVSLIRSGGEASKVILRGMSDKFTSFTIDGVRIPATDANERGVDLSTFSQGTLAGVELFKALTPDKDADAIAGSVNLVTRKAPSQRQIRLDIKEVYNHLSNEGVLYDINGKYGERFFDDVFGVQITGNYERRDRSDERFNLSIEDQANIGLGFGWKYTDFALHYNSEIRKRGGAGLMLDINTPDKGSIRINNLYNFTNRNYINYSRNYPVGGDAVFYSAWDREQEIATLNSSVQGENYLLGLKVTWGASFAESDGDYPYNYRMVFSEPSIVDSAGMRPVPPSLLNGPPEAFIPLAYNNFAKSQLDTAYFTSESNIDREKTAHINLAKEYAIGDLLSAELKLGGKYRHKNRFKSTDQLFAPYYLNYFQNYTKNPDGSISRKNFAGTPFEQLQLFGRLVLFTNFLHTPAVQRNLYDRYSLNPLVNRDLLRAWYELNRNGVSENGRQLEYNPNPEASGDFYDITERVTAGYLMNTFNLGSVATLIAGARVEHESNDYLARYADPPLAGFPTTGTLRDTTTSFKETIWLPNVHLTVRPLDFMNLRLAAYRAIARPDFNTRLAKLIARKTNPRNILIVGNPNLKNAKSWNFEVSTSFYGNTIGLFTVSAFYREIQDMFHTISDFRSDYRPDSVRSLLDTLGIKWRPSGFQPGEPFSLTYAVNSTRPTKVWGVEIEHQTNLNFLPGLLSNIVLSYNFSFVRSETFLFSTRVETVKVQILPPPFPATERYRTVLTERRAKLEGQPDFFGNVAIGYDIEGFSARLSVFFQGEFARSYSARRDADPVSKKFSRWDLSLKQRIGEHLSVFVNLNNLTSISEDVTRQNTNVPYEVLRSSQRYGLAGDVGIRLEF